MEKFKLNNGVEIPCFGIGTFMIEPDAAERSVEFALRNGYRLIDTANAYMNEKAVGRAIKKSEVPREEIFVSTKLWPSVYKKTDAIEKTLERLNLEYIDLLFLHQPAGDWKQGYKQLEKAYKEGKIKAIGISNFEGKYIKELLEICEIKPQVIQVECHPYFPQEDLRKDIEKEDIKIMSWYPLGHGDSNLINEEVFTKLAQKYNKTNAQIILRWHIQMGFIVIPGTKHEEHILQNGNILDFALTDEEMNEIAKINKNKRYYERTTASLMALSLYKPNFENQK